MGECGIHLPRLAQWRASGFDLHQPTTQADRLHQMPAILRMSQEQLGGSLSSDFVHLQRRIALYRVQSESCRSRILVLL